MDNFLEEYSNWLDESEEHLSNQAIATFINLKRLLSDKEKQFIEDHLDSCSQCKSKYEQIAAEDKEMDKLANEEKPVTERIGQGKIFTLPKVVRYAAAAVILITMFFAVYYLFIKKDEVLITEKDKPEMIIGLVDILPEDTLYNKFQELEFI